MAYTTDQYQTLVSAIAQGAMLVKYADKEVQYRTLDEMLRLKRDMESELKIGTAGKSTRRYAQFSTGLNRNC
jgi:hypothetical protein